METIASVKTSCDSCKAALGQNYPNKRGSLSISLEDGQDSNGYDRWNRYDFCGESCLRDFLNKRAKTLTATASDGVKIVGGLLELDATQGSAYKEFQAKKEATQKTQIPANKEVTTPESKSGSK